MTTGHGMPMKSFMAPRAPYQANTINLRIDGMRSIYPRDHYHGKVYNDLNLELGRRVIDSTGQFEHHKHLTPSFGGNGLGAFVYARTYSREMANGKMEQWNDTVYRVMSGWAAIMLGLANKDKTTKSQWESEIKKIEVMASAMYATMFHMKWLPPGRGLWNCGTEVMRRTGTALFNCSYLASTNWCGRETPGMEWADRMAIMMDELMLGSGVGTDMEAVGVTIHRPKFADDPRVLIKVDDSREGWVCSVHALLMSYIVPDSQTVKFDTSGIRKKNTKLNAMGGIASGPEPLVTLLENIRSILDKLLDGGDEARLTVDAVADVANELKVCVVSGNLRRSAGILLGPTSDTLKDDFAVLKHHDRVRLQKRGWTSNNSQRVTDDNWKPSDFHLRQVIKNGETGFFFELNARKFARMREMDLGDAVPFSIGVNPCAEQILIDYEMCNLVENFLPRVSRNPDEAFESIKHSYWFAKAISLLRHHVRAVDNASQGKMRLGVSLSGICDVDWVNRKILRKWYYDLKQEDIRFSDYYRCPQAHRLTSIKPSGTVSLLPYCSPGIHPPEAAFIERSVRVAKASPLYQQAIDCGYRVEDEKYDPANTAVVYFPIKEVGFKKTKQQTSMKEQIELAALYAEAWADNAVSITVTIPHDEQNVFAVREAYNLAAAHLKTVSFLPLGNHGYDQPPLKGVTEDFYSEEIKRVKPPTSWISSHEADDTGCSGDACLVKAAAPAQDGSVRAEEGEGWVFETDDTSRPSAAVEDIARKKFDLSGPKYRAEELMEATWPGKKEEPAKAIQMIHVGMPITRDMLKNVRQENPKDVVGVVVGVDKKNGEITVQESPPGYRLPNISFSMAMSAERKDYKWEQIQEAVKRSWIKSGHDYYPTLMSVNHNSGEIGLRVPGGQIIYRHVSDFDAPPETH